MVGAADDGLGSDTLLAHATEALISGPRGSFREWPPSDLEMGPPGVYAIWKDADFLYVGISYVDGRTSGNKQAKGVFGRLASHASGRRSGDQFNIYICDRYVVPALTTDDLLALSDGARFLDGRTRAFIEEHLSYRVWLAPNGAEARRVESLIRREGLAGNGTPLLNGFAVVEDEGAPPYRA